MSHHDYAFHQAAQQAFARSNNAAAAISSANAIWTGLFWWGGQRLSQEFEAAAQMHRRAAMTFDKPAFNLPTTQIGNNTVTITEEISLEQPYCNLLHFKRSTFRNDPKVLLVAPMSGHYATLLRGTVESLLPHHDVYITDWKNARDVDPRAHGDFGLDTYAQYIEEMLNHLGSRTHVIAVCQPTVPVLAAISQMASRGANNQPLSMTLMGGPIDTRAAPTEVSKLGQEKPLSWFRNNAISTVPYGYGFAAQGTKVYPGFKQLAGFWMMNAERHNQSHKDMFNHLRWGDSESAEKIAKFYDEYLSVMDIPERFYLETIDMVFQRQLLAKGEMFLNGEIVDPSKVTRTALMTIEGGRDDISAPGQTFAAHNLCVNIPRHRKFHHLEIESGHYGIFEGRRWREEICPRLTDFIRQRGVDNHLNYSEIPANTRSIPPNLSAFSCVQNSSYIALQK